LRVPCLAHHVRWGAQRGPFEFVDGLDHDYRCPFTKELMGDTAENLAARLSCTREAMDDWALMSQQRAGAAMASGCLAGQIAPIDVLDGKQGPRSFAHAEFPRPAPACAPRRGWWTGPWWASPPRS
jgi:acetyl-CoA acetyltransferase